MFCTHPHTPANGGGGGGELGGGGRGYSDIFDQHRLGLFGGVKSFEFHYIFFFLGGGGGGEGTEK